MTNLTKLKIPCVYGNYSIDEIDFVAPLVPYGKRLIGVVTLEDRMSITMQYEVKEGSEERKAEFERALNLLYSNL
jgi:acyl dehydratase